MAVPFIYPNPTPVLPILNGFSVHKKPTWPSLVETAVSGREVMAAVAAYPLWEFDLTFEALRSQTQNVVTYGQYAGLNDQEQILTMFLVTAAQYGRFYYNDPTDNSRATQVIGIGNGSRVAWPMIRAMGGGVFIYIDEPVGGVNVDMPMTIYLNGTPLSQSGNWSIGSDYQTLTFTSALGNGVVITADFYYYYLCRFTEDIADFDQFLHNLWTLRSLKFRSVKD